MRLIWMDTWLSWLSESRDFAPLDNLMSSTTDPLGARAAEKPTYCHDLHATALHPLRIHHEQIALYHNGIIRRITDVHGCVLHPILAQTPTVPR